MYSCKEQELCSDGNQKSLCSVHCRRTNALSKKNTITSHEIHFYRFDLNSRSAKVNGYSTHCVTTKIHEFQCIVVDQHVFESN